MAGKPVTNPAGLVFQALACDLRLKILNAVNCGATDTGQLAARLGICSSSVARATGPLLRAGLLARRPRQRWHGAPRVGRYELAVTPLAKDLIHRALAERPVLDALRVHSSEERAA